MTGSRINWRAGEAAGQGSAKRTPYGWAEWELKLLRGAMSELDIWQAVTDCAQMICRSRAAVERKMHTLRQQDRQAAAVLGRILPKKAANENFHGFCNNLRPKITMPAAKLDPIPQPVLKKQAYVSDFIRPLSRESLMAGKASPRQKAYA